ncbi:hypothetical protein DYB32_005105 [Aphanomyces invadans]|uniref:Temptin Cys/Cys disulfide domain-containing protein n=1 Tax=Aphanomyces invadans TaxID=157072 RepID=A0A3R6Z3V3_9STRA|nr:hypothetical protein DYB32_005105 [Aphanomyces invadans]
MIPNGDNVVGVAAVGHINSRGGGPRNAFGLAFQTAGALWTPQVCQADSDGDGATNGEELGDPCCAWNAGQPLTTSMRPTHPGLPDSFSPDQLTSLKCAIPSRSTDVLTSPPMTPLSPRPTQNLAGIPSIKPPSTTSNSIKSDGQVLLAFSPPPLMPSSTFQANGAFQMTFASATALFVAMFV